jgi:DNA-directed RNA polymerase specialized sigma24 family protein
VTSDDRRVEGYEGLCRRFASNVFGLVPDVEFDDLCQLYRLKAWRALASYDRAHEAGLTEYRYVQMCLKNLEKDLRARVWRPVDFLEDLGRQSRLEVETRLLCTSSDEVYAEVEHDGLQLPPEIDGLEAEIVVRLYVGWSQADVARGLGLEKNEMTRYMRSIRLKLDDWRPPEEDLEAPAAELEIARAA